MFNISNLQRHLESPSEAKTCDATVYYNRTEAVALLFAVQIKRKLIWKARTPRGKVATLEHSAASLSEEGHLTCVALLIFLCLYLLLSTLYFPDRKATGRRHKQRCSWMLNIRSDMHVKLDEMLETVAGNSIIGALSVAGNFNSQEMAPWTA